ncbi:MAG: L-seryl-tRNA(Sec) selenium transferase [Deltaproteobacteria bacterium ADurb.BinA179]|nr:MAG: L-seryl-tRNA(Sec) selenium transferase [Deltaproteobacteria bacterium ADurb.BinA179]
MNEAYRSIPKVDVVLKEPVMQGLPYDEQIVKRLLRDKLDMIRFSISAGRIAKSPTASEIAREVASEVRDVMESGLVRVINAAGVVVFTNLGRAPLAQEAIEAATDAARSYSDLEYNLSEGRRGSRQDHIRPITRACFGAEDALVVNNNAAAVMLVLASLARGREVIVSRGELVEIGGSFRMPDVMALSGALMREVGTTNKTRVGDYRDAISSSTGLIMKVHRSNFSVVGFTDEVSIEELAALGREFGIPVFVDMGSGVPFDLTASGIPGEWTVPSCLQQGADVLCFSGDKVLGGPQAGIVLGRADLVETMARHPLHRAVRVDKFTIASLGATLKLLAQGRIDRIPVLNMITEPAGDVKKRAQKLMRLMKVRGARVVSTRAVIGGGSAPTKSFDSYGVLIRSPRATEIHANLRSCRPAVLCRIENDSLIFDLKAVDLQEVAVLARKISEVMGHGD